MLCYFIIFIRLNIKFILSKLRSYILFSIYLCQIIMNIKILSINIKVVEFLYQSLTILTIFNMHIESYDFSNLFLLIGVH
jgi:hypothetical protein